MHFFMKFLQKSHAFFAYFYPKGKKTALTEFRRAAIYILLYISLYYFHIFPKFFPVIFESSRMSEA